MERIQRKIALCITGASPGPSEQRRAIFYSRTLDYRHYNFTLRKYATTQQRESPPCQNTTHYTTTPVKPPLDYLRDIPLLYRLYYTYTLPLLPRYIETIDTIKKLPSWASPVETHIPGTVEEAIEHENENKDDVKIYTDSSGIDGHIGAAAVLTRGFHPFKIARHHLGLDTEHTVYEGKCIGQLLGLHLLNQLRPNLNISTVSIAVDNQASILAHQA